MWVYIVISRLVVTFTLAACWEAVAELYANRFVRRSVAALKTGGSHAALELAMQAERFWSLNFTNGSPASKCRDLSRLRTIVSQVSKSAVATGAPDPTIELAETIESCSKFFGDRSNFFIDGQMMTP